MTTEFAILTALVADLHSQHGGSSVSLGDLQTPTRGYLVSIAGYGYNLPYRFLMGLDVAYYISASIENARRQKAGELFIGTWLDDTTGYSYLDLSINVRDKGTALAIARTNKQIAIYDVANQRTIEV